MQILNLQTSSFNQEIPNLFSCHEAEGFLAEQEKFWLLRFGKRCFTVSIGEVKDNIFTTYFKMTMVHMIKPNQSCEQTNVSLCHLISGQISSCSEYFLHL